MFLIKSKITAFEKVWSNKTEDDFLRFVPDYITKKTGVVHTKEDLDISIIDENPLILEHHIGTKGKDLKAIDGEVWVVNLPKTKQEQDDWAQQEKTHETVSKCKVKKLKQWPYDAEGNFLGHEAEDEAK